MKKSPNIQSIRLELIQWLTTIENMDVLKKIVDLKKQENSDWWDDITAKEKESIEYGLKDAEAKKLKSHSNARNLYDKWL